MFQRWTELRLISVLRLVKYDPKLAGDLCRPALVSYSSTDFNIQLYKVESDSKGLTHFCCFLGQIRWVLPMKRQGQCGRHRLLGGRRFKYRFPKRCLSGSVLGEPQQHLTNGRSTLKVPGKDGVGCCACHFLRLRLCKRFRDWKTWIIFDYIIKEWQLLKGRVR